MNNDTPRFEILYSLPAYGPDYIPVPEGFYSDGFPIKFTRNNGSEWIGNFKGGRQGEFLVQPLKNSNEILAVCGGRVYIMNPNETTPLSSFGESYENVIEYGNKTILTGVYEVAIIENIKKIVEYDLSKEGLVIKETSIENDQLIGLMSPWHKDHLSPASKFVIHLKTYAIRDNLNPATKTKNWKG